MLHIYWGMGQGKSSTLNGQAIRAHGAGLKVGIFRFLKGQETSEDKVFESINIPVKHYHYGTKFVFQMNDEERFKTKKEILNGLLDIKESSKDFDVIVLDEILDLCADTVLFLSEKQLIDFINSLGKDKEILISGHTQVKELFKNADLITEYTMTKHYFDKGVKARKGFEY